MTINTKTLTICALLLSATALAAQAPVSRDTDPAPFRGLGTSACGQFAKFYAQSPIQTEDVYFQWALGFMSGLNTAFYWAPNPNYIKNLNAISVEYKQEKLRAYCNTHPLANYADAVADLFNSLPVMPQGWDKAP